MSRAVTVGTNDIKRAVILLKEYSPHIFNSRFYNLKMYRTVREELKSHGIFTLSDLEEALDCIDALYDFNGGKLKTLAKHLNYLCVSHTNYCVRDFCFDLDKNKIIGRNKQTSFTKAAKKQARKVIKSYTKKKVSLRKFSYKEFLSLADWKEKSATVKRNDNNYVVTKRDFGFYVGSGDEVKIFNRLNKDNDVIDIRGQDLIIKHHRDHEYHPDLVVYHKDRTVEIIEVKPVILMASNEVLKKYAALKKYSESKGFRYSMMGISNAKSKIITLKELKKRKIDLEFMQYVLSVIDEEYYFCNDDLLDFKARKRLVGKSETNKLYYDLAALVIQNPDKLIMYTRKGEGVHSWKIKYPKFPTGLSKKDI